VPQSIASSAVSKYSNLRKKNVQRFNEDYEENTAGPASMVKSQLTRQSIRSLAD